MRIGLTRYKSGIFADNFSSYDNCDYTNKDFYSCIDAKTSAIRPMYECANAEFLFDETSTCKKQNNVITLPIVQIKPFCKNDSISEVHNVQEYMIYSYIGSLTLTPSVDTWVNNLRK